MDPTTNLINPNSNPPGTLVTMNPQDYIPRTTDPTVPIPPGLVHSTIEQSITTTHAIIGPEISSDNFTDDDAGLAQFQAYCRIQQLLSHGFNLDHSGLDRDDWLTLVTNLLADITNSIRTTHSQLPPEELFTDIDEAYHLITTAKHAASSLSSFFTTRFSDPSNTTMCMRCLEECNIPITHDHLDAVLMSCDQNIRAAHSTIINEAIRNMHTNIQQWADERTFQIQNKLIEGVVNGSIDQKIFDEDARIQAWINSHVEFIQERLKANISHSATSEYQPLAAWAIEAADVAYARATESATKSAEEAAQKYYNAEHTRLLDIAKANIAEDLKQNITAAELEAENELAAFKHRLKIETEQKKDNATKAANAAVKKVTRMHPHAPPVSTTASQRSRANSVASGRPSRTPSRASSPERRTERSITPRASPAVMSSQALTEPLTDISVGPPSNSFEEAMLHVPEPSSVATSIVAPIAQTNTAPIPDQFTFFLNQITSQLSDISSKFDGFESRLTAVEQPRWTPSEAQPYFASLASAKDDYDYTGMTIDDAPDDIPDDNSDYEPPPAKYNADEDLQDFCEAIYCSHYKIKPKQLPKEHQEILALEFETSFRQWLHDHPEFSSYTSIPVESLNAFFIWRLGFLNRMANTEGEDQHIWIRRRDTVRATEATVSMEPTKSGPGLSGTTSLSGGVTNPPPGKTGVARAERGNTTRNSRSSPPAHATDGWITMGKGGKVQSFASIAAKATPTPPRTSPSPRSSPPQTNLPPRFDATLSRAQVEAMTKTQIVSLLGIRFQVTPRSRQMAKSAAVNLFLSHQSKANPVDLTSPTPSPPSQSTAAPTSRTPPRARPANQSARLNTEFTVLAHPDEVATRAKKLDPAEIVRTLRTAINQAHGGGAAQVTLLSGRWSSRLAHNFVLTFAGKPTNDQVYRYRSILTSPFGTGARIVPQEGYTKVVVHSVPVERDADGNVASSMTLIKELTRNPACEGLTLINPPQWFHRSIPTEKRHASITFAFVDTDGSRLTQLIKNPPSLFGGPTTVEKFTALPILRGCDRCHALDHSIARCSVRKGTIICPLCGGAHKARDHATRCAGAPHDGSLTCTCKPFCINCKRAGKAGNGHTALSTSCPLRKLYRTANVRSGDSSEEETPVIARMVEDPVPSSQPTADGIESFPPLPSKSSTPARVDDTPPPSAPTMKVVPNIAEWARTKGVSPEEVFNSSQLQAEYSNFVVDVVSGRLPIHVTPTPSL